MEIISSGQTFFMKRVFPAFWFVFLAIFIGANFIGAGFVDTSAFARDTDTMRLRTPGKLGDEVTFIPKSPFQLNPFARNPMAEKLIARLGRLRNQA